MTKAEKWPALDFEVYVVAQNRPDGSLPTPEKTVGGRFYFSPEEAGKALAAAKETTGPYFGAYKGAVRIDARVDVLSPGGKPVRVRRPVSMSDEGLRALLSALASGTQSAEMKGNDDLAVVIRHLVGESDDRGLVVEGIGSLRDPGGTVAIPSGM